MNDNKRTPIQSVKCDKATAGVTKGKVLYLRKAFSTKPGGDFFKITDTVDETAACVCYEATLIGEKKNGRLKEFYPIDCPSGNAPFSLVRTERNHVVATEETKEEFKSVRNDFTESYRMLRDIMAENKKNSDFTSFIPDFSVYYACDENGDFIESSTAYVWSATQNLMVFEKYIEDIHRYPAAHPEHKLFTVLKTALTLVKCVKILHEKGLLHSDINPANFGIPQRSKELLTDSITLLDVNSIYSQKSTFPTEYAENGYRAPELAQGKADNTSDIYSIGCTLFHALIVSEEISKPGFSKEYYAKLPKLIESSKLLSASEVNSNPYLKYILIRILKKSLADVPSRRYQSCDELVRDLKDALSYLYPSEIKATLKPNQELVIMEKELDKKRGAGTHLSLLYHLYQKPLFEYVDDDSESVDVLIVGFGNYGQKFLDSCMQVGQIYGKKLNVNVVSNNRIIGTPDKDVYLSSRPEITRFFCTEGQTDVESYGYIEFLNKEFATGSGSAEKNMELASQIIEKNNKIRYIFVALGDNQLNKKVAAVFFEAVKDKFPCSINFAVEGDTVKGKVVGNPVFMGKDIANEPAYKDIERMAFNTHLVWADGLNMDMAKAYQEFKEPYNYNSSFFSAISIKYKLYSLGLLCDDPNESASKYAQRIANDPITKNRMIALEHQRWNCEKICEGYSPLVDLEACVEGPTNNKKAKKHVCLLPCRSDAPLQTPYWNHAKWDTATPSEIATLDELDQLSIKLHQTYKRHADEMRRSISLFDDTTKQLKMIAQKSGSSEIAFSEWFSALSMIWSGISHYAKEYNSLKDTLVNSLKTLGTDDRNTATALVEIIDKRFALILESMKYTDWKAKDSRIVESIPFILTHKRNVHLAIPFSTGNNTEIFKNVAVPTVVNPSQVTYMHYLSGASDVAAFNNAIKYIFNFLPEKNVSSKLNFVLAYNAGEELKQAVVKLKDELAKNPSTQKILLVESEDEFDLARNVSSVLDEKLHVDAIEKNTSPLSSILTGAGVYHTHPRYSFDVSTKTFGNVVGCDFLKYIRAGQYLKVSDMFASKNSKGVLDSPLSFFNDYESLWKKAYRGQEYTWKSTCKLLAEYHETADNLVTVSNALLKDKGDIEKHRYLIPASSFAGASKIIDFMVNARFFEKNSAVYYYTPDSCEVTIYASKALNEKVKLLFDNPEYVAHPEQLNFVTTPHSVSVEYDNLEVRSLDLRKVQGSPTQVREMLRLLEESFSFIYSVTEAANDNLTLSFKYPTRRIKKLLTNEGNILEVYIYFRCLKSGLFDDVATSYEVSWDGTLIKNEFDIVVTKGFNGLLIEAKARPDIKEDFYFKLSSLANQFGTNCRAVLVADTIENPYNGKKETNAIQRKRGDMLDVSTVFNSRDIDRIEIPLAKLLNVEISVNVTAESKTKVLMSLEYLTHSQFSVLEISGIATVGQFMQQTAEDFDKSTNAKMQSYKDRYLEVQKLIKEKYKLG